jgi:hypothetical protein
MDGFELIEVFHGKERREVLMGMLRKLNGFLDILGGEATDKFSPSGFSGLNFGFSLSIDR